MSASNFLEEAVLNHFFKNISQGSPANLYLALYLSNPTDADTGTEVTGGGYIRQQITFGQISQNAGRATISNTTKVEFPPATTAWGIVSYFAIRDAATGGNLLAYDAFQTAKDVQISDKLELAPGALSISMD